MTDDGTWQGTGTTTAGEIRRAVELLTRGSGGVVEVRAIGNGAVHSGYFNDIDALAAAVEVMETVPDVNGIYITLNTINPALLARRANRIKRTGGKDATTADGDIIRRRWLPVDIDPRRPSGVSSTDAEHQAALDMRDRIADWLAEQGFPEPVRADSGNGAHLLYPIDLPNDDDATSLVKDVLSTLDALFSNGDVNIDAANFNAARIWKIYGTLTRKGDNTPERPHRRARIDSIPAGLVEVPVERLRHIADILPREDPAATTTGTARRATGPGIDLGAWLADHGIAVRSTKPWRGGTLYVLDECPFSGAHRDGAYAIQFASGAIYAGCHHAGCGGGSQRWPELRAMYEPETDREKGTHATTTTGRPTPTAGASIPTSSQTTTTAGLPAADYHLTDAGNSERLIRQFGDDIRYCAPLKQWFVWDGRRWAPDEAHMMLDLATRTAKAIFLEAADADTIDQQREIARWAIRSESLAGRHAMIDGAVFMVPVQPDELDAHPNLFNCVNGTLDLDTMVFREHRREDLLTKIAGVRYDPTAKCPLWIEHLHMIFGGDEDVIAAFQQVVGYSLLQRNPEQLAFILWGSGKNGKSETLKPLAKIMGDYAVNIEAETLMASRHGDGGRARPDVLRLRGARFVTVTEPGQNDVLSEPLIKSVTGDHAVTARPLYGNPVEFRPGAKIFIGTNHLPKIRGMDEGIWRRIWLFPFTVTIPPERRIRDYGDILFEREGSGILNWMIEGLRQYLARGELVQPEAVKRATQEYRISSNAIGRYLVEWCVVDPREQVGKNDLYEGYREWCETVGRKPLSKTAFGKIMKTMFEDTREGEKGLRYWVGIRRKTKSEIENDAQTFEVQEQLQPPEDSELGETDTTDTSYQTFSCTSSRGKVWENVSVVSVPSSPPSDEPQGGVSPFLPTDEPAKSQMAYSPDPCDYVYLGRTEYNQQCAACGVRGVTYRERPQAFNVKRGTAGLCGACFEAISGRQEKTAGDGEEVDP